MTIEFAKLKWSLHWLNPSGAKTRCWSGPWESLSELLLKPNSKSKVGAGAGRQWPHRSPSGPPEPPQPAKTAPPYAKTRSVCTASSNRHWWRIKGWAPAWPCSWPKEEVSPSTGFHVHAWTGGQYKTSAAILLLQYQQQKGLSISAANTLAGKIPENCPSVIPFLDKKRLL